jgi:hypothetical protein
MAVGPDGWRQVGDVPDVVNALALIRPPGGTLHLAALGRTGLYRQFFFGADAVDRPLPTRSAGYLEGMCEVGDAVWACGAQGQAYRLRADSWSAVDAGLYRELDGEDVERMLLAITARGPDAVFACGFDADVWRFDGVQWSRIDCPATLPLNAATSGPDGTVYFAGEGSSLWALDPGGTWRDLGQRGAAARRRAFVDLAIYRGKLHVAARDRVLRLDAGSLTVLPAPDDRELRADAISAADDRLWCVGDDHVFEYDGKTWQHHVCPEND